jgi:aryl-alcohol dehydrogenase-like predicted oxidoreductase
VPLEDSIGELARLQAEGKIRHVGVSNVTLDELARTRRIVEVVSVQNRYNVADRSSDDVLSTCERDGLAFIPWSPLVQGMTDAEAPRRAALERWARAHELSLPQAAIAWLLARSPAMLPIPGTSNVAHLEANVAAALAAMGFADDLARLI